MPQDLFDEARGRERSPLLCELVAAVADSAGLREYEAERGTRREHYRAAEEEGNRSVIVYSTGAEVGASED